MNPFDVPKKKKKVKSKHPPIPSNMQQLPLEDIHNQQSILSSPPTLSETLSDRITGQRAFAQRGLQQLTQKVAPLPDEFEQSNDQQTKSLWSEGLRSVSDFTTNFAGGFATGEVWSEDRRSSTSNKNIFNAFIPTPIQEGIDECTSSNPMLNKLKDKVLSVATVIESYLEKLLYTHTIPRYLAGCDGNGTCSTDQEVYSKHVRYILCFIVSIFVTYNWYFMMFYTEMGHRPEVVDFSSKAIHAFSPLIYACLKHNLSMMVTINNALMSYIPSTSNVFFLPFPKNKNKILFMSLFVTVFYVFCIIGTKLSLCF